MRVLVAEDDPIISELYQELLRARGHEPTPTLDGAQAWEEFKRGVESGTPYAMVVLDWQMPVMEGVEVCRKIRNTEKGLETYVLMITGRGGDDTLPAILDAGADDYIAKPITPPGLIARIAIAERRIDQQHARKRAEEALARARWLSGIGETSLALQHEINNPLTALLGVVDLLSSGDNTREEELQFLKVVEEQSRRIAEVMRRLSSLKDPRTVAYLQGTPMLDLSGNSGSGEKDK